MYSLLVVDDESLVRKSIVKIIDWFSLGFCNIYEAEDGIEALETCRKCKIDLVLTDIVMPFMDGIELTKILAAEFPEINIVILTGHEDFEYAKQSVDLGVRNYILKPVGAANLYAKMQEICHKLNIEAKQKEYIAKMRNQIHRSLQVLQEKFLYSLVCRGQIPADMMERIQSLELPLHASKYRVCMVEPLFDGVKQADIELFKFTAQNIVYSSVGNRHCTFDDNDGHIVVVFQTDHYEEEHLIVYHTMLVIQEAIRAILKVSVTCAIGPSVVSRRELVNSYRSTLKALECKYSLGYDRVYDFRDLNYSNDIYFYPYEEITLYIHGIRSYDESKIRQASLSLSHKCSAQSPISLNTIKTSLIEVAAALFRDLSGEAGLPDDLWKMGMGIFQKMEHGKYLAEMIEPIEQFAIQAAILLHEHQNNVGQDVVYQVKQYVETKFFDPNISLGTVAEYIAVSAGYLSSMFKKATGINFVKYLTDTRMEKAQQLLRSTDKKTYEIAYETGFSDPHYFSISFKKYTGMSPSDYRNADRSIAEEKEL